MNGIDAVRAYLVDHLAGCAVAPFTDALTHVHGTVGFNVTVGESIRTVEVAYELLEPDELSRLGDYLEHVGLAELLRAVDEAAILVTPAGAHPIEVHAPRRGAQEAPEASEPGRLAEGFAVTAAPVIRAFLLVEDDPDVAEAIGGYLQALGVTVCCVPGIADAEVLLADLCFDGIVVDLQLPDGDGLDWLSRRASRDRGFAGRSIVCTGGALSHERLEQLERSGAVFLEKPFTLGELAEALGLSPQPTA